MKNSPTATKLDNGDWHIVPGQPIYTYSSYWRCWSRLIMSEVSHPSVEYPDIGHISWMEMSLEPIGSSSQPWEEIGKMRLRFHCTSRLPGDKITTSLPESRQVEGRMLTHLDPEAVEFMLCGDIYGSIDWTRFQAVYRANNMGGGVPIEFCQKG